MGSPLLDFGSLFFPQRTLGTSSSSSDTQPPPEGEEAALEARSPPQPSAQPGQSLGGCRLTCCPVSLPYPICFSARKDTPTSMECFYTGVGAYGLIHAGNSRSSIKLNNSPHPQPPSWKNALCSQTCSPRYIPSPSVLFCSRQNGGKAEIYVFGI